MNLTDMLLSQNNGAALDALATQYGLTQAQTRAAVEALMPAFSTGLKRNASGPAGAAALLEALATGQHGRYLDNVNLATSRDGIADGNAILGHLFGSKDVSRAVAQRASAASGISSSILKQMLPSLATMVLGALFKGATGGSAGGMLGKTLGQAAGGGLLGTLLEGLVKGAMTGGREATRTRRRRRRSPLEDILGQVLGGRPQRRTRRRAPDPVMPPSRTRRTRTRTTRRKPQEGMFGDIFDQLTGTARQRTSRETPPRTRRTGRLEDLFGDMLEPGGNTDVSYQREAGDVFDQLLGPSRRR